MQYLFMCVIVFPILGLPIVLTILNIICLISKRKLNERENVVDVLIFVLGITYTIILYSFIGFEDYTEQLRIPYSATLGIYHAPIASASMPTILIIAYIAILGYIILRARKTNYHHL